MGHVSRRAVLGVSGAAAVSAALGACSDDESFGGGGSAGGNGKIRWWDHFGGLRSLQKKTFEKFEKLKHGKAVEYKQRNGDKLGEALQLAKRSDELPDVSSMAGLDIPTPKLIASGWFQPIDLSDDAKDDVKSDLYDGVHIFDEKVYSFPLFSFRQYDPAVWFNKDLADKAGLDPEDPPATYDDFRTAAHRARKKLGNNVYGCVLKAGMTDNMAAESNALAQAAGFEGGDGMEYRSGEYAYHSDPYLHVLEFLRSLQKDKLLRPGAVNWDGKVARGHWEAGEALYYFDGPWCPGAVLEDGKHGSKKFAHGLKAGSILVPDAHTDIKCYRGQAGGEFWLTKSSSQAEAVDLLFSKLIITTDYNVGLANAMDQAPRDLSAVDKSSALESYKKLCKRFEKEVYLTPNPMVKNSDVAKVDAEMDEVKPTLGDIVQGSLTGDVKNVKKALKKLSDDTSKERERALKAAKKKGAKVGMDDYSFPNWKPQRDYT